MTTRTPTHQERADMRRWMGYAGLLPLQFGWTALARFRVARFLRAEEMVDGKEILKVWDFPDTLEGYQDWLMTFFPDEIADRILVGRNWDYYAQKYMGEKPGWLADEVGDYPFLRVAESRRSSLSQYRGAFHTDERVTKTDGIILGLWAGGGEARFPTPEEALEQKENDALIAKLVAKLPPLLKSILCWRHGLDGGELLTLEACGARIGCERERVRQLEAQAQCLLRVRWDMVFGDAVMSLELPHLQQVAINIVDRGGWREEVLETSDTLPDRDDERMGVRWTASQGEFRCERTRRQEFEHLCIRFPDRHEVLSPKYWRITDLSIVRDKKGKLLRFVGWRGRPDEGYTRRLVTYPMPGTNNAETA